MKRRKPFSPYANIDWEKASVLFQKAVSFRGKSKYPQTKEILRILAGVGSVGLMFAFPGAAAGIGNMLIGKESYSPWRARKIFDQLEEQKDIKTEYKPDGKVKITITQKGKIRSLTYQLDRMTLIKPKQWDNKWRVVVFDIPNNYKRVRDIFRARIKQLGLFPLQESVYVSPYKCFDEIEFLRQLYGVAIKVRYLLVDKIEDDEELKDHFGLT